MIVDYNGVLINKFVNTNNSNFVDVPTSITWINTNMNRLAAGFMYSPQMITFDKETVKKLLLKYIKILYEKGKTS
jgi:hypothetical protein